MSGAPPPRDPSDDQWAEIPPSAGWPKSCLVLWFVFGFVGSVFSIGVMAATEGASTETWALIFALMVFGACALGAMAALAPHGDPLGGLLLGLTLGPIGWLLAIRRAKELSSRPKPDPDDDAA